MLRVREFLGLSKEPSPTGHAVFLMPYYVTLSVAMLY